MNDLRLAKWVCMLHTSHLVGKYSCQSPWRKVASATQQVSSHTGEFWCLQAFQRNKRCPRIVAAACDWKNTVFYSALPKKCSDNSLDLIQLWQSRVEIKGYSVAYFDCIVAFEVPHRWTSVKGGAHMRFVDSWDILVAWSLTLYYTLIAMSKDIQT